MKRVLITGSSGEIGSALVAALLRDSKIEIVAGIDVRPPATAPPEKFRFQRANVTEPCTALLLRYAIDSVIHAAYTVEPTRNLADTKYTATVGTGSLLESARAAGVQKFLHLSSATVYGAHQENLPLLSEDAILKPNRGFAYAQHKAAAEAVLRRCADRNTFSSLIVLRPSFVVGPRTANALMRHLLQPVVPLPATQSRLQFVHREDLVDIVKSLLRQGLSGTFNVAASGGLTATEMVRRLGRRPLLLPDRVLDLLDGLAWHARMPIATAPPAALDLLRYPWRVDSTALQRVLPKAFRYTSEEAFQSFAEAALLSTRR